MKNMKRYQSWSEGFKVKAEVQQASLQVLKNDAVWNKVEKLDIITNGL